MAQEDSEDFPVDSSDLEKMHVVKVGQVGTLARVETVVAVVVNITTGCGHRQTAQRLGYSFGDFFVVELGGF